MAESYSIKQAGYVRYFYDNIGQIIGRIETEDGGDAKAYDAIGNMVGMTFEGKTLNHRGDVVAHSDILSSLLIREERISAKKADIPERPLNPPEGKYDLEQIDNEIQQDIENYIEEYLAYQNLQHGISWIRDLLTDTHYDEYIQWISTQGLSEEQIANEEYIEDQWLNKFINESSDRLKAWFLEDQQFFDWAEEKVIDSRENREGSKEENLMSNSVEQKISYKIADINKKKAEPAHPDYLSIGVEDIYDSTDGSPSKKYYTPKPKGKFQLGEVVITPQGRGRIIRKQTDYAPYSYTIKLTSPEDPLDDITVVEEKQVKRVTGSRHFARRQEVGFVTEARIEVWLDASDLEYDEEIEKIKKNTNLSESQKITLAKERAEQIAMDKISSHSNTDGISIDWDGVRLDSKNDRVNWAGLVVSEEEPEEEELKEPQKEPEEPAENTKKNVE